MNLSDFQRVLHPYWIRIANMVSLATVRTVDDDNDSQLLQLEMAGGINEIRDEQQRVQNYGFTAVPLEGALAAVVFVGGKRDSGITVAVDDPRHRPTGLEAGEVCVYHHSGTTILLKSNGDVEITPSSGKTKLTGDLDVSGTVTATADVVGGGVHLKTHTHVMTAANSPIAVAGTVGTITGTSGIPS